VTSGFDKANKERFVAALRRKAVDRVPLHENVINGRFIKHFISADFDSSLNMVPLLHLKMAERLGMDMLTLGEYWRVPITSREDLESIDPPDIRDFFRRVDEYQKMLKNSNAGLNVYVHGPFDQTYLSIGYERFFTMLYDDIAFVEAVMDFYAERSLSLLEGLIKRNVDSIEIVDDIAYGKGLMVEPSVMEKIWLPRMKRLIAPILHSDIPRFFHSDGDVSGYIEYVINLGFEGLNPIEPLYNDIIALKKEYGRRITLMGNLDVGGVLAFGSEADIRREMRTLLKKMMPDGGYIAMSSSSISDSVIPENYIAMVETVRKHGRY
jgi:uroporphyrinogen decarboxylase